MHKIVLPLALLASLGATSVAMAVTNNTVTGAIKSLDPKLCTVTLDNKATYHFAKKCDFTAFKVGEKVDVTWHLYKKTDVGTKIVAYTAPTTPATTTTATPKTSS
jgi:hypothetical protein